MARHLTHRAREGVGMKKSILFVALLLTTAVAQDPIVVTELQRSYAENPVMANYEYRGELVTLVGKIRNIYQSFEDPSDNRAYLSLAGTDRQLDDILVVCVFAGPGPLFSLKIGGMAQVRGIVEGKERFEDEWGTYYIVWVEGCTLVKPYNGPRW